MIKTTYATALYALTPSSVQEDISDMLKQMGIEYEYCMYFYSGKPTPALKIMSLNSGEFLDIMATLDMWGIKKCWFVNKVGNISLITTKTLEYETKGTALYSDKKPNANGYLFEMLSSIYLTY